MIFFLFCVIAAGHGGVPFPFGLLEGYLFVNIFKHRINDSILLMLAVIPQVAGIIAIWRSYNRLMFLVVVAFSLIVIAAMFASKGALGTAIIIDLIFVLVAAIYIIKYFQMAKKQRIIVKQKKK
jgi:hypothetical protein